MATNFAVQSDIEAMYRPLQDGEEPLAARLLRMASARIRQRFPDIDLRIANGTLDADTVADVCASMVVRVLRNPEGVTQETVGSVSISVSAQVAPGYFSMLPDEILLLEPPNSVRASVGTIRVRPGLEHAGLDRGFGGRFGGRRRW